MSASPSLVPLICPSANISRLRLAFQLDTGCPPRTSRREDRNCLCYVFPARGHRSDSHPGRQYPSVPVLGDRSGHDGQWNPGLNSVKRALREEGKLELTGIASDIDTGSSAGRFCATKGGPTLDDRKISFDKDTSTKIASDGTARPRPRPSASPPMNLAKFPKVCLRRHAPLGRIRYLCQPSAGDSSRTAHFSLEDRLRFSTILSWRRKWLCQAKSDTWKHSACAPCRASCRAATAQRALHQ